MTNLVLLNNVDHKHLKVMLNYGAELGDNYMCVATYPKEFRSLQAQYPIVFGKNSEGGHYTPLALLGLEGKENLFVVDGSWKARYVPLCAACKPFYIGQQTSRDLSAEQTWVIHVDLDSPKLNQEKGINLFKAQGGTSEHLERISAMLGEIHHGISEVSHFVELLTEYDLLEPFSAEGSLMDGNKFLLQGFHIVNEEKLAGLSVEALKRLHDSGFLFDIHMHLASLSQISGLIERKNRMLSAK
jgi:hypothetical protein